MHRQSKETVYNFSKYLFSRQIRVRAMEKIEFANAFMDMYVASG